ncbi:DUF3394 domain-containing protein [Gracilibacillus massiliensis]|uniref:DUF3394 domain-containing protein n=1 Tax=Gracilibacillus massiliensis TaxID=1564956 RepID=UPI00071D63BB|nr:DUF3394 domain-containing protein [Gracilibacillus massiliensis]
MRTGIQGFKYDSAALLLPFVFTLNPTILLLTDVTWYNMVWAIFTATIGMVAFASFIQNWLIRKYHWYERILALITALLFIQHNLLTDIIAVVTLTIIFILQFLLSRRKI